MKLIQLLIFAISVLSSPCVFSGDVVEGHAQAPSGKIGQKEQSADGLVSDTDTDRPELSSQVLSAYLSIFGVLGLFVVGVFLVRRTRLSGQLAILSVNKTRSVHLYENRNIGAGLRISIVSVNDKKMAIFYNDNRIVVRDVDQKPE